ncbi:MAG: ABC transporter permease [Proteobacteria bacterium]|nr:ABC transporter permease [Pseudomonadota bacterium]
MNAFLLRRLAISIPTLLIVTVIVFGLQQMLPGDPALALAGEIRDPEVLAAIRAKYHLDQPVALQYAYWIGGALTGDLGISLKSNQPVTELVLTKLPVTLELAALSMLVALAIGIPAGVISAVKPNSVWDHVANVIGLSGLSIPHFWLGIMLILLVSVEWGLLPPGGFVSPAESLGDNLESMIMPALVLGSGVTAVMMRHTRSAMLGVLNSDYVRTARAKGLFERTVVIKHALRNALIPVVTLGALYLGELLSGAVLTESVFNIPGFGKLVVDAVFNRDYAVVQGVVLFTASAYILLNLGADFAYFLINPRMRG